MPLFTLDFEDDDPLFCVNFHPEQTEFVIGLATGRVSYYRYDPKSSTPPQRLWSTKRHKGSCRAIAFTMSGEEVVSCGSEGIVKKFSAKTGKVSHKASISAGATTLAINEDYVVIGDDEGAVHALRLADLKLHRHYNLADFDTVTAIAPLSAVNKHNFAVSADMHILRLDLRKDEVLSTSEDQEDEIMCGCVASAARSAWGMSLGVLTIWNNRGLNDQQQRVRLTKDGSVDAVLAGEVDDTVIAGTSDGLICEIDLVSAKIVRQARHDGDEVAFLDYDCAYRLVSGSMSKLKVWEPEEFAESLPLPKPKRLKSGTKGAKQDSKAAKQTKKLDFSDL